MSCLIHVYTADQNFARVLAENLSDPTLVHAPSALPAPDAQRPTRQQLRRELAEVLAALKECTTQLALAAPYAAQLGPELDALRAQQTAYQVRCDQLFFTLGITRKGAEHA